ncbi:phosphatase PAP2 family protein [Winogradskyella sp. DF17]|uniref:Phosphatase PAP2 family protein n=1 Tax=Winogradskyella pelagia TaxID=2819984 RepID=A0ABS3T178_9FLAO|nr:phosphatase PAP2 family protein [Winogradskyella sp. DF17]MBO3116497.1 phosphatase PAP2 family protein [Winogradskyella sp. DF17]
MKTSFILLFFLWPLLNFGQIETVSKKDSTKIWDLLKYDTKNIAKSVGHSLTQPLRWKGDDFAKLGILIGGTAALTTLDNTARDFFVNQQEDFPKVVRDFGWYFGSPQNYFMINAGLYSLGLFTKNEKIRKTSVLIISSSITSGLLQTFLKTAVGRARPGPGIDNYDFRPFSSKGAYHSFPSGHTVLAVTMAHSIAKQFKNTWVKIGIYTIGAIPPISRLIDDAHWITDVAFSTAMSILVVDSIDKYLFKEKAYKYPHKEKTISWNISFAPNQIGFIGTF